MHVKYKALTPCHIFGEYRSEGAEFYGPKLTDEELAAADHLKVLGAQNDTPPAEGEADYSAYTNKQLVAMLAEKGITAPANTGRVKLIGMLQNTGNDDL